MASATTERTAAALTGHPVLVPTLEGRILRDYVGGKPNAHRYWYAARNALDGAFLGPVRIVWNYIVIHAAKHLPSLSAKAWVFRHLGMKLGRNVTIASGATLDYFFPELIEIGDNTIIGMHAMILTHEFLHDRFRTGHVCIGEGVLVGAASTILAGVTIGHGATVAAASLVHKCVPARVLVGGSPIRIIGV